MKHSKNKKVLPRDSKKPGADKLGISLGQLFQGLLIIASGLFVFWPALHGEWIGDDSWYIVDNPLMKDPARIWKAWFQLGSWVEYYPIHETLQYIQWQLWHKDTFGYHLTNVILHVISALLVWRLLAKFGLRYAWFGGLLFAVHPMIVDSVALINEFKTSLSLPPFLLALCVWIDFEESRSPRYYVLALLLFAIAMLCKITMVMFPVVILLYAWWKRGRIGWSDLLASAPFFLVSLVLGLASIKAGDIYSQSGTFYVKDIAQGDALFRFVLAGETIAFYFSRCLLPVGPVAIYPRWSVDPYSPFAYLPWLVLVGVGALFWMKRAIWGRHALLGLGFFLVMLAPFWGFHWISYMNETWILEHLLYIPIIGLIGLIIAGLGDINGKLPQTARYFTFGVAGLAIVLLAWESHDYAAAFKDQATAAIYTLRYNPNSAAVHNDLGAAWAQSGRLNEAIEQFQETLVLNPTAVDAHQNLANALFNLGRIPEAIEEYRKVITLRPDLPQAHRGLGDCFMKAGQIDDAIAEYKKAVRLSPNSAWMHFNLGLVLRHANQLPEAIGEYQKAIALEPNYAEAYNCLGIVYILTGHNADARAQFEKAISIAPNYTDAQTNLRKLDALEAH